MKFSAFFTTASLLTIASVCDAQCSGGEMGRDDGSCAMGPVLFCHTDNPKCRLTYQSVFFDTDSTSHNEDACKGSTMGTLCSQQYCCG
ncbi:unnamed protein product [Diplocarpon coronariae]